MKETILILLVGGFVLCCGCAKGGHFERHQASVSSAPLGLTIQRKVNVHGVTVFYLADSTGKELTGPLAGSPAASFENAKMQVWTYTNGSAKPELIVEQSVLDKEGGLLNSLCFGISGDKLTLEIKGIVTGPHGKIPVTSLVSTETER